MFGFKRDVKKELNDLWTEIHKMQNFQTKIENAVPTFNKMYESIKELDEAWTKTYQVCVKMDEKIRKIENNKVNTTKKKGK